MYELPAEITNEALQLGDVPSPDGGWDEIGAFALTFNGYEYWGSFEESGAVANERRHETIADLRTCLFFEQRR